MNETAEGYLSREEAAKALGVTLRTIDRWARAGALTAYRLPPAHRLVRFEKAQINEMLIPRKGKK